MDVQILFRKFFKSLIHDRSDPYTSEANHLRFCGKCLRPPRSKSKQTKVHSCGRAASSVPTSLTLQSQSGLILPEFGPDVQLQEKLCVVWQASERLGKCRVCPSNQIRSGSCSRTGPASWTSTESSRSSCRDAYARFGSIQEELRNTKRSQNMHLN